MAAIRKVILENLDKDCREGIQYRMLGYFIPHDVFPAGYHCDSKQPLPYLSLASQKNHMALYLFCVYTSASDEAWFRAAWLKSGKKLDMGKSCVRFKKLEDVPLDVIGKLVKRMSVKKFIAAYEASLTAGSMKRSSKKSVKQVAGKKKMASKQGAAKKRTTESASKKSLVKNASAEKVTRKKNAARKAASKKAVSKKVAQKK